MKYSHPALELDDYAQNPIFELISSLHIKILKLKQLITLQVKYQTHAIYLKFPASQKVSGPAQSG